MFAAFGSRWEVPSTMERHAGHSNDRRAWDQRTTLSILCAPVKNAGFPAEDHGDGGRGLGIPTSREGTAVRPSP